MINKEKVKTLYVQEKWSQRRIAKYFEIDHHQIKRMLIEMGVEISNKDRKRPPFSKLHKENLSRALKGHKGGWLGKKMPMDMNYKNMASHLRFPVPVEWLKQFTDFEKLKFLNSALKRKRDCIGLTQEKYQQFIKKFYDDPNFNKLYTNWLADSNDIWLRPSLDHIIPRSQNANFNIDNLRFLTWFENRCKNDMSIEKWEHIKTNIEKYCCFIHPLIL